MMRNPPSRLLGVHGEDRQGHLYAPPQEGVEVHKFRRDTCFHSNISQGMH